MARDELPLRILSLDGGGVRGLSSIMILRRIMDGINLKRDPEDQVEPWQVFDIIGGTSTGGIIAVMLGRLRMSLDECQEAYLSLSNKIFTPKRSKFHVLGRGADFLLANGRFDASILEAAMKECISNHTKKDALLKDVESACKVFVVTTRESNSEPALLRSYKNPGRVQVLFDECKIWEACRATSAATTFFDPIQIGSLQQKFIDGAFGYNNPLLQAYNEATDIWGEKEKFFLSIGTGSAPGVEFKGKLKNIVEAMKVIVTETERTARDFANSHRGLVKNGLYFRFNVYHGLKQIGLQEYRAIPAIADATETYLDGETRGYLLACIEKLASIAPKASASPEESGIESTPSKEGSYPDFPIEIENYGPDISTTATSCDLNSPVVASTPQNLPSPSDQIMISTTEGYNTPPPCGTVLAADKSTFNCMFAKYAIRPGKHDTEVVLAWVRQDHTRVLLEPVSINMALLELSRNENHGKLRIKAVESILQRCDPDLEYKDSEYQRTPLIWAISRGHEAIFKLLLANGANPATPDGIKLRTPLSWAASKGAWKAAEVLLADMRSQQFINAQDIDGTTALDLAETRRFEKTMEILRRNGAKSRLHV